MEDVRVTGAFVRESHGRHRPEPGILCWNCRKLTPFQEERCQSCGAAFAGNTGGAYAMSRVGERSPSRASPTRSLAELLSDLGRIHDVSSALDAVKPSIREAREAALLFQCPSCGRFVGSEAKSCACGVRFSDPDAVVPCPECDSQVPALEDRCPICGVQFAGVREVNYSCPKCGSSVSPDALRCACGVWFED